MSNQHTQQAAAAELWRCYMIGRTGSDRATVDRTAQVCYTWMVLAADAAAWQQGCNAVSTLSALLMSMVVAGVALLCNSTYMLYEHTITQSVK